MRKNQHPYMYAGKDIAEELGVDIAAGLTDAQIQESRKTYGENAFAKAKSISIFTRIKNSLADPMLIMLMLAALITLGVNAVRAITGGEAEFLECVGIFIAIGLSVAITVIMEGKSAKAFETLSAMTNDNLVKVMRNGQAVMIPQKDVVVGDILCLAPGNRLPADARLIQSSDLASNESALTGESMPAEKNADIIFDNEKTPLAERSNMLYSGCFITSGYGTAVVTSVGNDTEFGKIASELSGVDQSTTPLQEKMAVLGKRIALLGSIAAAIVFIAEIVTLFTQGNVSFDTISNAFITSIVLIVAAVPEGMPTIVAMSLAINIIKMSKQNALVKKMAACETIGGINVICSDKTGTLTLNKMKVRQIYSHGRMLEPEQIDSDAIINNCCLNSSADLRTEDDGQTTFVGNPTECALLTACLESGTDYRDLRTAAQFMHIYPFSSELKNMTCVIKTDDGCMAYTKGSPEKIIEFCSMPQDERKQAEDSIAEFQKNACRVIAFAHKKVNEYEDWNIARPEIESDMIFDGFAAITDPLRDDVYQAVEQCRNAGIDVKILTGDNIVTAQAIAAQLDIIDDKHRAVEAKYIETLSDKELIEQLPGIAVIARSTPSVKMRVVNALKSTGNVVAVTGDGINDAPAIKNADVGIAMGITGTDVSKDASDIVLLDDSFATIVRAVRWGRGIYENFQRVMQFQLTVNFASVFVVLISVLAGFEAPFTALQLLWINIIMDGPPALTLGLEPMREDLMNRKPIKRNASLVSKSMFAKVAVNGLYISAIFMAQFFTNFIGGTPEQQSSILFTMFVVFQLFNAFNSRELGNDSIFTNLGKNKIMLAVFAATFALQVVITQFAGALFGTAPLSLAIWVKIILIGFSVIVLSEIVKLILRATSKKKA